MRTCLTLLLTLAAFLAGTTGGAAQDKGAPSTQDTARLEKIFEEANALMAAHKYTAAVSRYKEALAIAPEEPSLLFNGGLAAFQSRDYSTAAELWLRLKKIDPSDWHSRAKLIQAYQALGKLSQRDVERTELIAMWKSGKDPELAQQHEYCREQFKVNKRKVMAFEHFELKGERALRYVFSIVNEKADDEDFRISLGSYDFTNAVWRETANPKPKAGERLFHLDGYYKWGHATYGMYAPEPSYDQVRAQVIKILEGETKPVSTSTMNPATKDPNSKPKP
jgi:tetratricopeptide (TPR) repeat protein